MRLLAALVALACAVSTCSLKAQSAQTANAQTTQTAPEGGQSGSAVSLRTVSETSAQTASPPQSASSVQTSGPSGPSAQTPTLSPGAGIGFGLGWGSQPNLSPLTQPTLTPGMIQLMELETKFAAAVATGGGKAFASWFAEDGVTLGNGRPPVIGREAIAAQAQWEAKDYQLTWTAEGAQMGPSNDMGFTWGHYDGTGKDAHGQAITHSGRYITVWKRMPDGSWKVLLDASAEEPPDPGSCCSLAKP